MLGIFSLLNSTSMTAPIICFITPTSLIFSPLIYIAAAPPTISESSCVIEACLALL